MKLDKRACRHAANAPLNISLNAGVLYTDRVKYLVTAAVKLLGGHRVLAVYFYECERLKANDRMPKWVVFQGKDDFVTLERDAEGNVKWRDSMLENLVDESFYKFRESCVFYKGTDGVTISDFIHQSASGITILEALQVYQYGIRNKQAKKRRCKRDMGIVEKMKKIPAAPSNLARWIDRNVMPHYLFYSYDRNQPETQVSCTYCEKFSVIKKPKTGKIFVCPQCKQKAIAKAQGRRAAYHEDRETCQVIQKISDEELLIRIFKAHWAYKSKTNTPVKEIYENARLFIRAVGQEGTATDAYYYDSSYDSATHWRRGNRPRFSPYTSSYEADDTGAVYLPSLKRALQGTPWQYCALRQFYEPTKEAMQVSTYLRVYRRHPKLIEHLVKVGFERIVSDIVYRHGMPTHYESAADSNHYPDYAYGYAVASLLKGETDYGKMTIGSVARCVCCGGEQKNHRSIRCAECGNMYVCKGCGKTVHGYGRYIDNHFYCNECSYECTVCKEMFIGMPRIGIARSGEQRGICPACYEQVVSVCRNCTIHGDCLSIGANRFCPNQMNDLAA